MKRSYDTVASFYDRFARLVFGKAQLNAQHSLLHTIPPNTHILIAGGGTGWILEEIARQHKCGLVITYVDASPKMTERARNRVVADNKIIFIAGSVEEVHLQSEVYNIVVTPFLFDNLDEPAAGAVCGTIYRVLKRGGLWLYCDFESSGPLWQRGMLGAMYLFFRACCGIKAKRMPDITSCTSGYALKEEHKFYGRFIIARAYEKL